MESTDHDLLILLNARVEHIKENMPTKDDIHFIVNKGIEGHVKDRHYKYNNNNGNISWGTIAKILVGIMPPLLVLAGIIFKMV